MQIVSTPASIPGKNFSRRHINDIFLIFPRKTGFDIACKLSPLETICMKCQNLFSGENRDILICRIVLTAKATSIFPCLCQVTYMANFPHERFSHVTD